MVFDYFKKKKAGGAGKPSVNKVDPAAVLPRLVAGTAPVGEPTRKPGKAAVPELSPDEIGQRAYEIWVRKGQPAGTADQDWLEAEAELRAERSDPGRPNKPR